MTVSRDIPLHGTGKTVGDVIDAAVEAAGGGGSPQAGQPTRFLTLTYHHPGNEDGNSVSATTGIPIPDSDIAEGTHWIVVFQARAVASGGAQAGYINGDTYVAVCRPTGEDAAVYSYAGGTTNPFLSGDKSFHVDAALRGDSQFDFALKIVSNGLSAIINGMSDATPTDWTINVQLTPIAP